MHLTGFRFARPMAVGYICDCVATLRCSPRATFVAFIVVLGGLDARAAELCGLPSSAEFRASVQFKWPPGRTSPPFVWALEISRRVVTWRPGTLHEAFAMEGKLCPDCYLSFTPTRCEGNTRDGISLFFDEWRADPQIDSEIRADRADVRRQGIERERPLRLWIGFKNCLPSFVSLSLLAGGPSTPAQSWDEVDPYRGGESGRGAIVRVISNRPQDWCASDVAEARAVRPGAAGSAPVGRAEEPTERSGNETNSRALRGSTGSRGSGSPTTGEHGGEGGATDVFFDDEKAAQLCAAGNAAACGHTARTFESTNPARAAALRERQCELQDQRGCAAAWNYYLYGADGRPKDVARAAYFLNRECWRYENDAASKACFALGRLREKETVAETSPDTLFSRACRLGHRKACGRAQ